jgi:hypothetical protein
MLLYRILFSAYWMMGERRLSRVALYPGFTSVNCKVTWFTDFRGRSVGVALCREAVYRASLYTKKLFLNRNNQLKQATEQVWKLHRVAVCNSYPPSSWQRSVVRTNETSNFSWPGLVVRLNKTRYILLKNVTRNSVRIFETDMRITLKNIFIEGSGQVVNRVK